MGFTPLAEGGWRAVDICTDWWEDEGMTEIKVHHSSRVSGPEAVGLTVTSDWTKVTCDDCRLEQPVEKRPEYRTPDNVARMDEALARLDDATRALSEALSAYRALTQGPVRVEAPETATGLSEAAKRALRDCGTDKIGGRVWTSDPLVGAQLAGAGLIGRNGGLTMKGSILAAKLQAEEEERLFPL